MSKVKQYTPPSPTLIKNEFIIKIFSQVPNLRRKVLSVVVYRLHFNCVSGTFHQWQSSTEECEIHNLIRYVDEMWRGLRLVWRGRKKRRARPILQSGCEKCAVGCNLRSPLQFTLCYLKCSIASKGFRLEILKNGNMANKRPSSD